MSLTDTSKSAHLVIEYLQGYSVPVKFTIQFAHRDTLVLEFAEGPYWDTKWKFESEAFGLPGVIREDLMGLINQSDAVELSTAFVTPGSVSPANWRNTLDESLKLLDNDRNIIQQLPQEPKFDIVFGLKCKRNPQSVTLVFQPESESPSHIDALQRQNTYLHKQLDQNRNEISALREQLRIQGGVDLQRQVIHMEALIEKKLREMSDSTSKALQEVSKKHGQNEKENKKQVEQLKEDHQKQLAQLNADYQLQSLRMQQREREHEAQIQDLQSQIPPKEIVVTLSQPMELGRGPGTFTLDAGVVPQNAKKVTLLLYMEKGAGGSDQEFYVKAHTSIGSQKHYHHAFLHHYNNSAWVFDNVEWEFPIEPNHRHVTVETERNLLGYLSVVLYVVGYTI